MKLLTMLTVSVAALVLTTDFSNAFAQAKTRDEVRQELIQAENNGSRFVTDASYPDVSPVFQAQASRAQKNDATAYGGVAADLRAVPDQHDIGPRRQRTDGQFFP